MNYREDDLTGIRKARFASFVFLIVCLAAMFVVLVLSDSGTAAYISAAVIAAVLILCWWLYYRRLLFSEAEFFKALKADMRGVQNLLHMLETAVWQIEDGIVIVAEDGDVVRLNEKAKVLLAVVEDDLDVIRYDEYARGFSEKLERAAILEAAQEGRAPELVEFDGRHYKIGYVELEQEKGRRRGAVAVTSDVTEYTNVENMQKAFVANVSHELRTPLASVKAYAETLMTDASEDPKTLQDFLGKIVEAADDMNQQVKNHLSFARLEYMETNIETEEEDLTTMVKVSMQKLDGLAKKKSLTVNRMFPDERRIVEMNMDLIKEVIVNILDNAIKYSEEGGRIDVDIIPSTNCVQIVISDNGVGIPEEDISRVFERFYRGEKSRNKKVEGTGLGLAISKKIIEMHGGGISIESRPGRGTTVTISLPAARLRGTPGVL